MYHLMRLLLRSMPRASFLAFNRPHAIEVQSRLDAVELARLRDVVREVVDQSTSLCHLSSSSIARLK